MNDARLHAPAATALPPGSEPFDGRGRRWPTLLSQATFYAGCAALGLLPAALAAVLLRESIGEPILFLGAVVTLTWVLTSVLLVKLAGPFLRCRAIIAAGGLLSMAMCSLFLVD